MSDTDLPSECPHRHGPTHATGARHAVFLDRDGVLIEDTGYPSDPDAIQLLPGVPEGLRALQAAGWRLVVVTNLAGVARGRFPMERLEAMHDRLRELLAAEGVSLDAVYFCPHHGEGMVAPYNVACDHRKPAPGMLLSAAADLALDPGACWMIGDKESDVEAAHAAGCRAIRVTADSHTAADATVRDLADVASIILGASPADGMAR